MASSLRLQDKPHIPRRAKAAIDLVVDDMVLEDKINLEEGENNSAADQIERNMSKAVD